MPDQYGLDLKILLSFGDHYQRLYERGAISQEQFNQIQKLLDNFENYTEEDFRREMERIFSD